MVRLYRTFYIYIVIGETRCAGCLCTSSGWFKHTEPLRTFLNYILTEIARYIEFYYTSSGWFDWTEPSLTTSLQRIEGVQGAICTSLMRFKHIEPHRTFSNYILTEISRYIEFFYTSSEWFDCTEPSPTTSLQGIQGVQGAICTGSGRFKHIEPLLNLLELHLHRDNKVYRVLLHEFGVVRLYRTVSICIIIGETRCARCNMHRFGEVQAHRTSSNLIEPSSSQR